MNLPNLNVTAPLSISENHYIGTVVGQFQAVDPEEGALHFFQLSHRAVIIMIFLSWRAMVP